MHKRWRLCAIECLPYYSSWADDFWGYGPRSPYSCTFYTSLDLQDPQAFQYTSVLIATGRILWPAMGDLLLLRNV